MQKEGGSMQEKLKMLFKQIELNGESYKYFDNASLDKIVLYDENNIWEFVIKVTSNIPMFLYNEILEKLTITFATCKKIVLTISVDSNNNDYLEEYFNNIIDTLCNDNARYNVFKDRKIEVVDNKVVINVYNKVEKANLIQASNLIKSLLKRYGYEYDINIILKENGDDVIYQKIHEETEVVEVNSINVEKPQEEIKKESNVYRAKKVKK